MLISREELPDHIQGGLSQIPRELGGQLDIDEALTNFIKYRCQVEGKDYFDQSYKVLNSKKVLSNTNSCQNIHLKGNPVIVDKTN